MTSLSVSAPEWKPFRPLSVSAPEWKPEKKHCLPKIIFGHKKPNMPLPEIQDKELIIEIINNAYEKKNTFKEFLKDVEAIVVCKGLHDMTYLTGEYCNVFDIKLQYATELSKTFHIFLTEKNEVIKSTEQIIITTFFG